MKADVGNLQVCMAQKANMEAIFHSVADGILTVDAHLVITNINHAAARVIGVEPAEAVGRPLREVLLCRLWRLGPMLKETMETGEGVAERENILVRPDGNEIRALLTTNRLLDSDDKVAGAVIILRDITHLRELEVRLEDRAALHSLVGKSHRMQEVYTLIEQVAPTDSTVFIQGESGTGKELIADAIHRSSTRQGAPFIKVNCSALSESLLESELFGHVKGAFTGATYDRKGRFEMATGGTIFLDEIGDLTERIQVKLLRVLQEREIERVGDTKVMKIDVRVLAATHQPLKKLVDEGRFRKDLFYRLNVIPIHVPPLRDRKEDIPALASVFLRELSARMRKKLEKISHDALRAMMDYGWPGNVRELRNALEHGAVKTRGPAILLEDLPGEIVSETAKIDSAYSAGPTGRGWGSVTPWGGPRDEGKAIRTALEKTGWHRGKAAQILGIDRTTLWRKMKRLGIDMN
ncbi:MAG: sigma 54-interacting transcriptional regulator [Candidatus Eisenbacteria bacterium]